MSSINCENFSANDLHLFIESIEKISRMEKSKRDRCVQYQAQHLAAALRYLDQQQPAASSSTRSSSDEPEYEDIDIEYIALKDIICNYLSLEDLSYDSISLKQSEYHEINGGYEICYDDLYSAPLSSMESTKLSESLYSTSSTGIYESISSPNSMEVSKNKMTLKRRILDLLRKHLKNNS